MPRLGSGFGAAAPVRWRKGGAAAAFDPTSIPNLAAWYDAQDLGVGEAPVTWADKSGNARNLTRDTLNGTTNPTVAVVTELGGKKAVRFNLGDTAVGVVTTDRPYRSDDVVFRGATLTVFFVLRSAILGDVDGTNVGSGGAGLICGCTGPSGPNHGWQQILYPNATPRLLNYYTHSGGTTAALNGNWRGGVVQGDKLGHVFCMTSDGTNKVHYTDGVETLTLAGTLNGLEPFFIGMSMRGSGGDGTTANDSYKLPGDFAEFLQYNRVLSAAEKGQVTDYLKTKYGIA